MKIWRYKYAVVFYDIDACNLRRYTFLYKPFAEKEAADLIFLALS